MKLIMDALLLSSFWFIALYTIKLSNVHKMAIHYSDAFIWKKVIFVSKILIGVWIVVEFGLITWHNSIVFLLLKDVVSTPFVSHVIYAANIIVLFNATILMSGKALETERYIIKAEKKAISFANGLIVLGISMIIFYYQSIYWGEFNYIYTMQGEINVGLEALIDGIFMLIPAVMVLVNGIRYLRQERIRKLVFRISVPIILLLAFSQAIMTKLIVLYDAIKSLQKLIFKKIGFHIKSPHEDTLLIASSLSFGTTNAKINAYYLTSYFFAVVVLWTSQVSPFPIPNNLYENGLMISFYIGLAIFLFWVLEGTARLLGKFGRIFRIIFIPLMLILTIYPFYTSYANINSFVRTTEIISFYNRMSFALGNNKYLFFLCLGIMQASLAYLLHVITGEAHNDRHHYSVMPILFIVQVMVLAVMYPVCLSIPSYALAEKKAWIIVSIFGVGLFITILMSSISYYLFTSVKSEWSSYIDKYWKDKSRIFIIVGLITMFAFLPIYSLVVDPIHNNKIKFAWENVYTNSEEHYYVTALIEGPDPKQVFVLENDNSGTSKLIAISTEDGHVFWEKAYADRYMQYKVWSNNTIVLTKANSRGFTVINLRTGKKVYDYIIEENAEMEFLNFEVNDRTVLMTDNTVQTLFDRDYGEIKLDTMGNNFYKLIPGNQCALMKNEIVFLYQNDRLEKIEGIYNFEEALLIYYDDAGMIVFNQKDIVKYSSDLQEQNDTKYLKLSAHNMTIENSYYNKINDTVVFYLYDGSKQYAYVFSSKDFTYKIIKLEQRIKGANDLQNIKLCDDQGNYLLYDDYQLTLFNHENIMARQWFQLPLNQKYRRSKEISVVPVPLYLEGKIIWVEENGKGHAVTVK